MHTSEEIIEAEEDLTIFELADELLQAARPDANGAVSLENETDASGPKLGSPYTSVDQIRQVRRHVKRRWPALTREHIVALADEYYAKHGTWPKHTSGLIAENGYESWEGFNLSLRIGRRGLPGGSTLKTLLIEEGRLPSPIEKPRLDIDLILAWADAYFNRTQTWPCSTSGTVTESHLDSWDRIDQALRRGQRGLCGGQSLSQLLLQLRGAPAARDRRPLTEQLILSWADAHYDRTGALPTRNSGNVVDALGEVWSRIETALMFGRRGLPEDGSLAKLFARFRGKRHKESLPNYDLLTINGWVLGHYTRTGLLPRVKDGPIPEAPGETWSSLDCAFRYGRRGLAISGFTTLKQFLDDRFPRANFGQRVLLKPRIYVSGILKWADAHHARTGKWPNTKSGAIPEAPGETWRKVNQDMSRGCRGLGPNTSLLRLLEEQRGLPPRRRGPLTFEQILKWADEHRARTGKWPTRDDRNAIPGAPHETWYTVCCSLHQGLRGLPNGSSLAMLLLTYRGRPHCKLMPPLKLDDIEAWILSYREKNSHWPGFHRGGRVDESPYNSWRSIDQAFKRGCRGLASSGYRSLADFMNRRMGKPISPQRGRWKGERTESAKKQTA